MTYEVEIIFKHTVAVDADSEENAIANAAELALQLDADETNATILKRHDPNATPSYEVGDHFMGLGGEFIVVGITPKAVFYEEVENLSLEGSMMDRTAFEDAIRKSFIYNQRKETLLEKAKRLIDNYCCVEFQERANFNNLSCVPVAYTTTEDSNLPIQVNVDLNNYNIYRYLSGVLVEIRHYGNLAQMIEEELQSLDFSDLTWFTDEQIARATNKDTSGAPVPLQMNMDTHDATIANTYGTWHVVDHVEVDGHTFWLMHNDTDPDSPPIIVDSEGTLCIRDASDGFSPHNLRLLALEVLTVPSLPDETISVAQMKGYGYCFGGMLPLNKEIAQKLYGENCCIYRLYDDNTEGMIEDTEDLDSHAAFDGIFGIEKVDWLNYLHRKAPQTENPIRALASKLIDFKKSHDFYAYQDSLGVGETDVDAIEEMVKDLMTTGAATSLLHWFHFLLSEGNLSEEQRKLATDILAGLEQLSKATPTSA